jgi:PEGA domain
MKISSIPLLLAVTILSGCVSTGPAISKSSMGNLDVYVTAPQGVDFHPASIYVDGVFVGNVSQDLPVLYLKRGKHVVRVELADMKTYEQQITILGDPNHQFLDVTLEKK